MDTKKLKAIFKGILTFIPLVHHISQKIKKTKHSSSNAEFCYNLWLRILIQLEDKHVTVKLNKIGELGSGGSFGVGICALLTGAQHYFALEIEKNADIQLNLKLLEELLVLFNNKTPLKEYSTINIEVPDLSFPEHLIKPNYTDQEFVNEIKNGILSNFKAGKVTVLDNWLNEPPVKLDFIFSRAVMEHVNDPSSVYRGMKSFLKEKAIVLHDIEFHSHGITNTINGHFAIPRFQWFLIQGRRKYFQNRWTLDAHVNELVLNKFRILHVHKEEYCISGEKESLNGASIIAEKINGE